MGTFFVAILPKNNRVPPRYMAEHRFEFQNSPAKEPSFQVSKRSAQQFLRNRHGRKKYSNKTIKAFHAKCLNNIFTLYIVQCFSVNFNKVRSNDNNTSISDGQINNRLLCLNGFC